MKLQVFYQAKSDTQIEKYLPKIEREFSDQKNSNVNIIFVSSDFIRKLNKQYRGIDSVTDVLSFNIDEKNVLGEVYICSEYIVNTHPEISLEHEILRLIIHGILHLIGYDHSVELTEITKNTEEMFVKQEKMLENVLS